MRNLKTFTAVAAIALTMGVVGVSAASATVTFDGTISGSTWAGAVGPCDFSITSTGRPSPTAATTLTLDAATFAGRGTTQPCDPTSLQILNNITVNTNATAMSGTLSSFRVKDNVSGCTYNVAAGTTINNDTTAGSDGKWAGTGSATSSNFPCIFAPASITVSDGLFT